MAKKKNITKKSTKPAQKKATPKPKPTKSAKSNQKAKPKVLAKKTTITRITKAPPKTNLNYYNDLKKETAEFYKETSGKKRIDRAFLTAKTNYLFKVLKSKSADNIITPGL